MNIIKNIFIIIITFLISGASVGYFAYQKVSKKEICEKKSSHNQNNQILTNKPEENKDQGMQKEINNNNHPPEEKKPLKNEESKDNKFEEKEEKLWFTSWKAAIISGTIISIISKIMNNIAAYYILKTEINNYKTFFTKFNAFSQEHPLENLSKEKDEGKKSAIKKKLDNINGDFSATADYIKREECYVGLMFLFIIIILPFLITRKHPKKSFFFWLKNILVITIISIILHFAEEKNLFGMWTHLNEKKEEKYELSKKYEEDEKPKRYKNVFLTEREMIKKNILSIFS